MSIIAMKLVFIRFLLRPSGVPFVTVTAETLNLSPTLLLVVVDSGNLTLVHDIRWPLYALAKQNVSSNSQTIHKQYISMKKGLEEKSKTLIARFMVLLINSIDYI